MAGDSTLRHVLQGKLLSSIVSESELNVRKLAKKVALAYELSSGNQSVLEREWKHEREFVRTLFGPLLEFSRVNINNERIFVALEELAYLLSSTRGYPWYVEQLRGSLNWVSFRT